MLLRFKGMSENTVALFNSATHPAAWNKIRKNKATKNESRKKSDNDKESTDIYVDRHKRQKNNGRHEHRA